MKTIIWGVVILIVAILIFLWWHLKTRKFFWLLSRIPVLVIGSIAFGFGFLFELINTPFQSGRVQAEKFLDDDGATTEEQIIENINKLIRES